MPREIVHDLRNAKLYYETAANAGNRPAARYGPPRFDAREGGWR
jgi:hypothetical protein